MTITNEQIAIITILESLNIADKNGQYQMLVIKKIQATHQSIESITIGEMIQIIDTATAEFNRGPTVRISPWLNKNMSK